MPVEESERIARRRRVLLEKGYCYRHIQLARQSGKSARKLSRCRYRFGLPLRRRATVNTVAVAPHLREQGDIRAHFTGLTAIPDACLQVFLRTGAGPHLQQRYLELVQNSTLHLFKTRGAPEWAPLYCDKLSLC